VAIDLGRCHALGSPLDPHLLPDRVPVDGNRRSRVLPQLTALAAACVGEEDKAALVGSLQEDEADGGPPCGVGGRERHRLRQRHAGAARLVEPAAKANERVGRHAGTQYGSGLGRGRGVWPSRGGQAMERTDMKELVIDADGHVLEPPDVWQRYTDPAYRARAIRVRRGADGRDRLEIDGRPAQLTT